MGCKECWQTNVLAKNWTCCCGDLWVYTALLGICSFLYMIGGIVMLAMSPPEMCKMMNGVKMDDKVKQEVNCDAMPEKLDVGPQVIGSLGVVFVFGCTVLLFAAAYAMKYENAKRIRQFYQLLWVAFYAGIL